MNSMASPPEKLEALAKRHETWHSSSAVERVRLARLVLEELRRDEWSTAEDWMLSSVALEKLPPSSDPITKNVVSATRFVLASTTKQWLATFIEATTSSKPSPFAGKPTRIVDERFLVSGPVGMGMGAPGMSFELFSDASLFSPNEPGGNCSPSVASFEERCRPGSASLVLGAGNQNFLALVDVLERVFVHGECVLLKHHPLRPFLLAPYGCILRPLLEEGIVAMTLDAGIPQTTLLVKHPLTAHVHITGSEGAYNAIVAAVAAAGKGPGKSGGNNAECGVTGELGCATPWIVSPGHWTDAELANGAKLIATAKKTNGGCNCLSAQVVVLPSAWPLKERFVKELEGELARQRTWPAYYTQATERADAMFQHAESRSSSSSGGGSDKGTNWVQRVEGSDRVSKASAKDDTVLVHCGVAADGDYSSLTQPFDNHCLTNEAFGPVLALVEVSGGGEDSTPSTWLAKASAFANSDQVCGSLSCSLLAPKSLDRAAVDACCAKLEFGTVGVNCWSLFGYLAITFGGTWGAHPSTSAAGGSHGHGRSGRGRNGNLFGVEHVAKTVVTAAKGLETLAVDLSSPPPTVLFDLLHLTTIRSGGVLSGLLNVAVFVATRTLQLFYLGSSARRYGAVV